MKKINNRTITNHLEALCLESLCLNSKTGIFLFLEKVRKIIDPVMKKILATHLDKKTIKPAWYHTEAGGKRLRPALAIVTTLLMGGKLEDILYPAAGLEILHNNSLILDDIIDKSRKRRGKLTQWARHGQSIAECMSVIHSASLFQAALKSKCPVTISEIFARTMKHIIDGEILDILFEQNSRHDEPYVVKNRYMSITEKDYMNMAGKKTASLFEACCEVGGICAGASVKEIKALKNFGYNLGLAFQIKDDILDVFGEDGQNPQNVGKDIEERKLGNAVIYFAFKELREGDKQKLLAIMAHDTITKNDIKQAIDMIRRTKSKQSADRLGRSLVKKAKKSLGYLPQNQWNYLLSAVADFVMERE